MDKIADRFMLTRELGSGGMATVHLGRDEILDRPVAVKVLKYGFDDDIAERFQREGRTAARLSHPNVVQVYDAGEAEFEGRISPYIVMEHVSGGDLKDLIDSEGTLDSGRVASLGDGICSGLAHAHDRGVIHRDIKPHNVLLDEFGSPKLTDFGIARALDSTDMTVSGVYLGTVLYSAPEQFRGEGVTAKSDIYSLGATLYQAVTRETPFSGSSMEVANQHATREPEPPDSRTRSGDPDPEMDALILSCLAKDPADRPSAAEARDRLSSISYRATGPVDAVATSVAPPAAPGGKNVSSGRRPKGGLGTRRKKPLLRSFAGALALVLILIAGAVFALMNGSGLQVTPGGPQNAQDSGSQAPGSSESSDSSDLPDSSSPSQESQDSRSANGGSSSDVSDDGNPGGADGGTPGTDGASTQEAAQTVRDVYQLAAAGDYDSSYELLSDGFRGREVGSRARWAGTFSTLESISFTEGPTATISGDTAQVTGNTRAVQTDGTEFNRGTWTLVQENGRWRLDSISVQEL